MIQTSLRTPVLKLVRRLTGIKVRNQRRFRQATEAKSGLEIGGPSGTFQDSGILPIYKGVASLDNCVFSVSTRWEGTRAEGRTFNYHPRKPAGLNFIREGTDLQEIATASYDFVLSAHNLEHLANPLKALKEWKRVLRPTGALILILPHYKHTFDHRRQPTPVSHMVEDYVKGTDETDTTHVDEVLELHDLSRDPGCSDSTQLRERTLRNFENRCMHHHVFDETNSRELLAYAGLSVQEIEFVRPHHLVLLGTRE